MTAARVLLRITSYAVFLACCYWLKYDITAGLILAAVALAAHYGAESLTNN